MNNPLPLPTENRPLTAASFWRMAARERLQTYQDAGLDIAEIRLDKSQCGTISAGRRLLQSYNSVPTILTLRIKNEGGAWRYDEATRLNWFQALCPHVAALDVELNSPIAPEVAELAKKEGKTLILSCHFIEAPWDLTTLRRHAAQAAAGGANIFKFAATVVHPNKLAALREFLREWKRIPPPKLKLILAPMGAGAAVLNSRLAFAQATRSIIYVHGPNQTADGQPTLQETVNFLGTR